MSSDDVSLTRHSRRQRRWLIALGVWAAVVIAVRVPWGLYADARLEKAVKAIRDRGEPLERSAFAAEPVDDADNAAELYRKAAGLPLWWQGPNAPLPRRFGLGQSRPGDDLPADQLDRLVRLNSLLTHLPYAAGMRKKMGDEVQEILRLSADARRL
jgi:hypothetical protein